jgi:hypothetical protein
MRESKEILLMEQVTSFSAVAGYSDMKRLSLSGDDIHEGGEKVAFRQEGA